MSGINVEHDDAALGARRDAYVRRRPFFPPTADSAGISGGNFQAVASTRMLARGLAGLASAAGANAVTTLVDRKNPQSEGSICQRIVAGILK
jgi:hypothetical protein